MYRRGTEFVGGSAAVGFLIVRLVAGVGLMMHGFPKIQHAFNWMGPHSTMPGILQALSAGTEFGGGLLILVGLLTPLAALLLICNFLVALAAVHIPHGDPFVAAPGHSSCEAALDYLAMSILFFLGGPGAISLDALLFRNSMVFRLLHRSMPRRIHWQ